MSAIKPGSKYARLHDYLRLRPETTISLTLEQIERILEEPLPSAARSSRAFWSNRRGGHQASAWLEAGYHVQAIDLEAGEISFARRSRAYTLRMERGEIRWDGPLVLALRTHLGLNQAELAEALGVRQQTISEWESGRYEPSRGRSKHLSMLAEGAGFRYLPTEDGG